MKKIMLSGICFLLFLNLLTFFMLVRIKKPEKERKASPSIDRLLLLAKEPLGQTMYVWGGGWNEEDTGAGVEARSLGLSPVWKKFAKKQDQNYDYRDTRYQIHDGLDCSGYIGWVVYNLFEAHDGEEGYVEKASVMAENLARKGFGEFTQAQEVSDWQAGDIMSMEGHVWMALGTCEDGSVVLIHASPPGVSLSGTKLPGGGESRAERLARKYMSTYYPKWTKKYPVKGCDIGYLTDSSRLRWSKEVLSDAKKLREMNGQEVLQWMFGEKEQK